jgi:hypothetical protein
MSDVDISWRLLILYIFLFLVSIIGALLCTILIYLFKRYDVFHINFRTIMWNILTCVLINNLFQMMRPILLIVQYLMNWKHETTENCLDLSPLPSIFCTFISIGGLLISLERLYATLNYTKYEYENFVSIINKIFVVIVSLLF